ncbi:MAG: patatin-like phospholipase family protein [Cyclobacteriaceae bacterium]|nr:patatin-like phospholipase family protein [Cyclobacteriaceae bacterium]
MKKIGIALSGGGCRAAAHLGMLQVLRENGIYPHRIAGSSAGAIIGAFLGAGYAPDEILKIIIDTKIFKLIRPALNLKGILKIQKIKVVLEERIQTPTFEAMKIPLTVVATNLSEGRSEYFEEGNIIDPIAASSAIPVIFDPVYINGKPYVDGGILNNLPVEPLEHKVDFIIGMHCNPVPIEEPNTENVKRVLERSLMMAINCNAYARKDVCDLFMEPPETGKYNVFDIQKLKEIYQIGYDYADQQMPLIYDKLKIDTEPIKTSNSEKAQKH